MQHELIEVRLGDPAGTVVYHQRSRLEIKPPFIVVTDEYGKQTIYGANIQVITTSTPPRGF